MINNKIKNLFIILLSISFVTAIITDTAYGNIANAQEFALGSWLYTISTFTWVLVSIIFLFSIIWILFVKNFYQDYPFHKSTPIKSKNEKRKTK